MAEEINKTYTSNSLYNDSTGVIAFAEQLKQELINWANYQHVTEELGKNRPDLQNELNNLFLSVYERFLTFLNDADASEEAINTWKEIENFLADYTDDKTLASIVEELNSRIESRLTVPLESTTGSSTTSTMTQKAITETIDASKTFTTGEKVDNVGIDAEPTAGSENLVKSGGVKAAIPEIVDNLNEGGATKALSAEQGKNLVFRSYPFKYNYGVSMRGQWNPSQYYRLTDLIPIFGGEKISGYSTPSYTFLQFYREDGSFISALNPISDSINEITLIKGDGGNVPSDAFYFRAGTFVSYTNSYVYQTVQNPVKENVNYLGKVGNVISKVDNTIAEYSEKITQERISISIAALSKKFRLKIECANPPQNNYNVGILQKLDTNPVLLMSEKPFNEYIDIEIPSDYDSWFEGGVYPYLYIYKGTSTTSVDIDAKITIKSPELDFDEKLEVDSAFKTLQKVKDVRLINNLTSGGENDVLTAEQGKLIGDVLYDKKESQEFSVDLIQDSYYNTRSGENNDYVNYTTTSNSDTIGWCCAKLNVNPGDRFIIYGKGSNHYGYLYAFTDSTRYMLDHATDYLNTRKNGLEIVAPDNSVYLYLNFIPYDETTDKLEKYVTVKEGLISKVASIESSGSQQLKGKKIVVFGDSTSAFTHDDKGWPAWASEITSADFINLAIGGTHLNQRGGYSNPNKSVPNGAITLFDDTQTYQANKNWVFHLDSNTNKMMVYKCIADHTGAWDDNDFTEDTNSYAYSPLDIVNLIYAMCDTDTPINDRFANQYASAQCIIDNNLGGDLINKLNTLKAIDWNEIDAVVILGGGNDFGDSSRYGTSGSTDVSKTLGAINYMVQKICSTYKNVSVYAASPIVRWFKTDNNEFPDDRWCDVYAPSGNITYAQFVDSILNEFKLNHVPYINLYDELGWNKWNFWNYFNLSLNDGTHPYYGFYNIAQKITSWLAANKSF